NTKSILFRINFTASLIDFLSTAARAKIIGSQEVHVKKGSTISLSCVVNVHASSISWYHGSSIVDFDSARGGISLETEKTEGGTSSRLMLTRATLRDSGNYTCVPTGAISASVQVHVLNGEHPAAMQTSSGVPCPTHQALILLFVSLNSCNLSKLIFFISNLLETVRFLLTTTIANFLVHIRRLASSFGGRHSKSTSYVLLTLASIGTHLRIALPKFQRRRTTTERPTDLASVRTQSR
uniref:Ig-like domain-containing protein n=1 Tax=Anopheles minimus TaxID=112268 RepID=A0A182VW27_9DIPT